MDSIDLRLIDLLRENARSSYAELARKVGLSAPAVHERVGKLEAAGTIRGYRAEVDHEALGLGVTALIGIIEDSGADTDDVLAAVRAMPEVESCYFMAGVESYQLIVAGGHDRRAGAADRTDQPDPRRRLHPHRDRTLHQVGEPAPTRPRLTSS